MRHTLQRVRPYRIASFTALAAACLAGRAARAQQQPGPPPGFEPQTPPPVGTQGGQPPPYYYPPPPAYGYPPIPVGPKTMDYEEGDPVPPGYRVETRVRKGLIIGGAVTFGTFYAISVVTGALANAWGSDRWVPMYIPIAGPFVTIATTSASEGEVAPFVLLGVAQAGGATLLTLGIALPKTQLVRNDVSRTLPPGAVALTPRASSVQVGLLPAAPGGSAGLTLVGAM